MTRSESDRLPAPRRVRTNGIELSVHEAGRGPAVVFSHGFPELAHSWRHQIAPVAAAGFRAIAPDQRGYGASDAPDPIEAYAIDELTADLVGILDAFEIDRAVFVGHDWGGFVAWAMPVLHPDRTLGVVGVNTPYIPFFPLDALRQMFGSDERHYILWFQEPGVAESVLDPRARLVFEKFLRRGIPREEILRIQMETGGDFNPFRRIDEIPVFGEELLTPEELGVYVAAFERTGFRGGIQWYRNLERNGERFPEIGTKPLDLPCLMVTAAWDAALPPEMAAGMHALCRDLEIHEIAECGHWTPQEKPAELNSILIEWLRRRFPS